MERKKFSREFTIEAAAGHDAVDYPQGSPCGDFPVKADKLSTKINSTNSATRAGASSEASK